MKHLLQLVAGSLLAAAALPAQTLTWTQRNTGIAAGLQYTAAAHGAGKYAVVAYGSGATAGTFQSQVALSADGATWSVVTLPTAPVVRGIAYGGGLWIVPAERNGADAGNTQNILTSPDGTTWTARTTGAGSLWKVAHTAAGNGNLFVAVGLPGAGPNAAYSTDAITWTRVAVGGADTRLGQLAGGGGVIVAGGNTGGVVYTTANGSAWTTVTLPGTTAANAVTGLVHAGGEFIASVRFDGGASRIFTSANGATWTARGSASPTAPANFTGNGLGASGAASGGGARVILAGGTLDLATFAATPYIFTSTGNLATWTAQQFGGGDFASHNFAFFANNLWLVGNNKTQLFTAADTAGGGTGGGSSGGDTGGGTTGGTPAGGYLGNLSIRSTAGSGTQTLIVGVTVGGAGTSGDKRLLIRGIGPALGGFGLAGALADPRLEVYSGSTVIAANDNWDAAATPSATQSSVGAFALTAGSRDAALIGNTPSGGYTVQITGAAGTTGVALAELYDLTPTASFTSATPRLTNLSARTQVGTGADILIAGFNLGGSGQRRLLIRAIGPGLATFGLTGVLADPKLEVYSGSTIVASNDNWDAATTPLATQSSVGAFGLTAGSRDAVLIVNLAPGSYTAQVSGVGGTSGIGLVELYELP